MKNICDWNNCNEIGEYKAPVERDNSKKFRMLCLEHVKEFNKNWNYFSGMNDEQIITFLKSDMTWHKPTQSFSSSDNLKIVHKNLCAYNLAPCTPTKNYLNQFNIDKNKLGYLTLKLKK